MQKHKLNIFPEMDGEEYQNLKKDIIENGFDEKYPIYIYEDCILDGWNRQKVCDELNIKPLYKTFQGTQTDAIHFVMRTNKRRNLSKSQWACIAVEAEEIIKVIKNEAKQRQIANLKQGSKNPVVELVPQRDEQKKSDEIIANMFNTNSKYIQEATKFKKENPETFNEIKQGQKTITQAKKEEKIKAQREKRVEKLPEKHRIFNVDKKYNIIYVDPPWKYPAPKEFYGQDVQFHYNTMTLSELENLPVKEICQDDCVLYLWATAPLLDVAINLLKNWGFQYKSCLIWDKVKHNMGFYSSVRHEILLIGGRGQSAPTDKKYANQTDSVYSEPRQEHSRKPLFYYEMIEKMHPHKNQKIELFARNKREGWDSWGNEID